VLEDISRDIWDSQNGSFVKRKRELRYEVVKSS